MVAVVLVEPFDPVNVAATARAMASFGAGPLILVDPVFDVRLLDPAIGRGGTPILDSHEVVASLAELRDRFDLLIGTAGKPSNGTHLRTYLTPFELRERAPFERAAFVFGRESDGLRNEELALCDVIVSIETRGDQRALNLSHAVAVVLAIALRVDEPVQQRHPPSTREMRERLVDTIISAYEKAATINGAYQSERRDTQRWVWNRLLARGNASEQDVRTLFGLAHEIDSALSETSSDE